MSYSLTAKLSIGKEKVYPTLQSKQVTPRIIKQTIEPDPGYDGLSEVIVDPMKLQEKTVTPSETEQTVTPDPGYDGLSEVTVESMKLQEQTVTPSETEQTVTPDPGYDGLSEVTVESMKLQAKTYNAVPSSTGTIKSVLADNGYDGLKIVTIKIPRSCGADNIIKNLIRVNDFNRLCAGTYAKTVTIKNIVYCENGDYRDMFNACPMTDLIGSSNKYFIINSIKFLGFFGLFDSCTNLKEIDMSLFKFNSMASSYVRSDGIFSNCVNLAKISNLNLKYGKGAFLTFENCSSLVELTFNNDSIFDVANDNEVIDLSATDLMTDETVSAMIDTIANKITSYNIDFVFSDTVYNLLSESSKQKFNSKGYGCIPLSEASSVLAAKQAVTSSIKDI